MQLSVLGEKVIPAEALRKESGGARCNSYLAVEKLDLG
jgi:hypothetical protein